MIWWILDGGPAIGLGPSSPENSLVMELDIFEDFRGGIIPEDVDEDEEWSENWRLPR